MKFSSDNSVSGQQAKASSMTTALVVLSIVACILCCGLILAVPTRSISSTTVYKGF